MENRDEADPTTSISNAYRCSLSYCNAWETITIHGKLSFNMRMYAEHQVPCVFVLRTETHRNTKYHSEPTGKQLSEIDNTEEDHQKTISLLLTSFM